MAESQDEIKRLYRSRENKVVAGVCGGISEYFNVDPVWIRLVAVLLMFADGIGLLLYLIAWVLIPKNPYQAEPRKEKSGKKNKHMAGSEAAAASRKLAHKIEKRVEGLSESMERARSDRNDAQGRFLLGGLIVALGIGLLLKNLVSWFKFEYLWPFVIIAIGIFLLTKRSK